MDTRGSVCPTCANLIPDVTVWIVRERFYCSEGCAREAALYHETYH